MCKLCGKEFQTKSPLKNHCGNRKDKGSCAYKRRRYMSTQRNKRWRKKNPERNKENDRRWKMQNRDKLAGYYRKSRLKLRFQIFQRDNFTCQYCGKKAPEVILEIDHKYPKSKGGLNQAENYITSCRDCNIGKGDSILQEFNN